MNYGKAIPTEPGFYRIRWVSGDGTSDGSTHWCEYGVYRVPQNGSLLRGEIAPTEGVMVQGLNGNAVLIPLQQVEWGPAIEFGSSHPEDESSGEDEHPDEVPLEARLRHMGEMISDLNEAREQHTGMFNRVADRFEKIESRLGGLESAGRPRKPPGSPYDLSQRDRR